MKLCGFGYHPNIEMYFPICFDAFIMHTQRELRCRRALRLLIVCLALAGSAYAQVPQPTQGSNQPRLSVQQPQTASSPSFEFHSSFWLNLHHTLYEQARIHELRPTRRTDVAQDARGTSDPAAALSANDKLVWDAAVDYYSSALARRDLLFDGEMVSIKDRLVELEECPDLSGRSRYACGSGLQPGQIAALEQAAPIYRAKWWPEQDRANRAWIASVLPLVEQYGGRLAQQLSGVYRTDWPAAHIRVDVCAYAGVFGGYTTLDPLHITISSTDERNRGLAALEILFHEASHALAGSVRDTLTREYRQRSKPIPRDLWHALLFYTTGEFVKRAFSGRKGVEYVPYANRHSLYARGWQGYQQALDIYWKPYLDGVARGTSMPDDFDRALAHLAESL